MDNKIKKWLYDALSSIGEINSYFLPENFKYEFFENDIKTIRAVERNMEIIGEALNRITKENPNIKISEISKIIATRNKIIHGYDTVSSEILWGIIVNHLPKLKEEINKLLG